MSILLDEIIRQADPFWVPDEFPGRVDSTGGSRTEILELGRSREGRPLFGFRAGGGPRRISLIAGAHADEPVGPSTLLGLCRWLAGSPSALELLDRATFSICPHVNPDGAHRNREWCSLADYKVRDYLEHVVREAPGDDVEFGFPDGSDREVRPENRAVARFLEDGAGAEQGESSSASRGYHFHASLHSMGISEGAWFLIDREHIEETSRLRADLVRVTRSLGVALHDWDRGGEKGFHRIEPGFTTTPTSRAMRLHFEELGDPGEAAKFRASSMEFVASLGGSPLRMVSELPIFQVTPSGPHAPRPGHNFLEAREALHAARLELASGKSRMLERLGQRFGLERFPHRIAAKLQLAMIFLGSGLAEIEALSLGAAS